MAVIFTVMNIASEEDIQLVLDASAGQVVFADASVDITDKVIDWVITGND